MIHLHSIAFSWDDGSRIEIESPASQSGSTITSVVGVDAFDFAVLEGDPSATFIPAIGIVEDPDQFYEPVFLRENTDYWVYVTLPGNLEDIREEWQINKNSQEAWPFFNNRLASIIKILPPRTWKEINVDGYTKTTVVIGMNFASFVGTVDLSLSPTRSLKLEVACSKLSYFDDFKLILRDISNELVELLFEIDNVAGFRFEEKEIENIHPSVILFHLRRLMEQNAVPFAVESIIQNPHNRLVETTHFTDISKTIHIDPEKIAQFASSLSYIEGGPFADLFLGLSPISIPEVERKEVVDTSENRYVKAFLVNLSNLCYWLLNLLEGTNKKSSIREVKGWINTIDDWLSWQLWNDVGDFLYLPSNSQVLLRRNGYREILEADMSLQYGLQIPWERGTEIAKTIGDIRPIFELYEYWCYFSLRKALRIICGLENLKSGSFFEERNGRIDVSLKKGKASRIEFSYLSEIATAKISLFYNKVFNKGKSSGDYKFASYSTRFDPDFSILIECNGQKHWLHFDAKYRLDFISWEKQASEPDISELEDNLENSDQAIDAAQSEGNEDAEVYKKSDLYKMHTYRDAILESRGAYVLFPGSGIDSSLFVRHPSKLYRDNYHVPGVGAFPLRPQSDDVQINLLATFIKEVISTLADVKYKYSDELGIVMNDEGRS